MQLIPHHLYPPKTVTAVEVSGDICRGRFTLDYRVIGDFVMDEAALAERADELWTRTCFELFVSPVVGDEYFEFNFGPSTKWAAYRLAEYRAELANLAIPAPVITRRADGVSVDLDLRALPEGPWRVGITAITHEADGTRSFWSLAHPVAKPDFHDPVCFVLKI